MTKSVVEKELVLKKKIKLGVATRNNDYMEFILEQILERRVCEARDLVEVIVNFPIKGDVLNALIGSLSSIDPSSTITLFNSMCYFSDMKSYNMMVSFLCNAGRDVMLAQSILTTFIIHHATNGVLILSLKVFSCRGSTMRKGAMLAIGALVRAFASLKFEMKTSLLKARLVTIKVATYEQNVMQVCLDV
ncbi:hypothetical protein DITRI_Ditri09bG0050800 [Diplodiscus trichospermus]